MISDQRKDTFVHMHGTKWFNLQSGEGRGGALCCLLALQRRFNDREAEESDEELQSDTMESIDGEGQS